MKKWITAEEIIKLIKKDWELIYSSGIRTTGRYWLQKGGDTIDVHSKTVDKLRKNNLIDYAPRQKDEPFWLTRYKLK